MTKVPQYPNEPLHHIALVPVEDRPGAGPPAFDVPIARPKNPIRPDDWGKRKVRKVRTVARPTQRRQEPPGQQQLGTRDFPAQDAPTQAQMRRQVANEFPGKRVKPRPRVKKPPVQKQLPGTCTWCGHRTPSVGVTIHDGCAKAKANVMATKWGKR